MADCKKNKQIKQKEIPKGKSVTQGEDLGEYYFQNPAWAFENSDQEMWAFPSEHIDLV